MSDSVRGRRADREAPPVHVDWAGPIDLPLRSEADVQAACGVMHVHGRRYGEPTPIPLGYTSCVADLLASHARLAAQCSAELGRPIAGARTSVAQAALLSVGQYLAAATAPQDDEWSEPLIPGGPPFTSRDGVRYELESLYADGWAAFWFALGAPGRAVARGWHPFQHRYATATCALPEELFDTAARASFRRAVRVARACGVGVVAVRQEAAGAVAPWRIRAVDTDTDIAAAAAAAAADRAAPMPESESANAARPAESAPLAGITVVESTRRVQGPLAGHLLRQLGAHVVRIEQPGGDPLRGMPPIAHPVGAAPCSARFHALNRGKFVVEADLGTAEGRDTLRALVADAHVFLHNWAPGKVTQWALDDTDLVRTRPDLVYAWASGWFGAPGRDHPQGTDFLVQARTGMAARLAVPGDSPTGSLMTLTDVLGALVCVEAVLAALLARLRTGRGQRTDSSLYSAALHVMSRAPAAERDQGPAAGIPVCKDLADLAADPRFSPALEYDGCALVRTPWEFYV